GVPDSAPLPAAGQQLGVLYRDAALVVVDKPAGLIVHRGWAQDEVTALSLLRGMLGQWVYPVHRLDRGTSGALVFALTPEIAGTLGEAFAAELVQKRYLALVRGLAPETALVDHPIAKEPEKPKLPAQTRVARLCHRPVVDELSGVSREYSLVEAFPLTGRPHQVRRHLKHLNHPIIGDVRYGKSEHNRLFRRRFGLERLALHAERISFPHPTSGTLLQVSAPLPADLVSVLTQLGAPQGWSSQAPSNSTLTPAEAALQEFP
ncbi:MAG TPA: pseudouridine synthase, partial [Polyangiaceae bacterium]|nr:pseudouridine synthase [Polyangiaceae bacterium]